MPAESAPAAPTVRDVPEAERWEARFGSDLAGFAQYVRNDKLIAFVHTEVYPAFEGRGVGGALVRASLDAARAAGARVIPLCPFYAGWIKRHPDYQDLVYENASEVAD